MNNKLINPTTYGNRRRKNLGIPAENSLSKRAKYESSFGDITHYGGLQRFKETDIMGGYNVKINKNTIGDLRKAIQLEGWVNNPITNIHSLSTLSLQQTVNPLGGTGGSIRNMISSAGTQLPYGTNEIVVPNSLFRYTVNLDPADPLSVSYATAMVTKEGTAAALQTAYANTVDTSVGAPSNTNGNTPDSDAGQDVTGGVGSIPATSQILPQKSAINQDPTTDSLRNYAFVDMQTGQTMFLNPQNIRDNQLQPNLQKQAGPFIKDSTTFKGTLKYYKNTNNFRLAELNSGKRLIRPLNATFLNPKTAAGNVISFNGPNQLASVQSINSSNALPTIGENDDGSSDYGNGASYPSDNVSGSFFRKAAEHYFNRRRTLSDLTDDSNLLGTSLASGSGPHVYAAPHSVSSYTNSTRSLPQSSLASGSAAISSPPSSIGTFPLPSDPGSLESHYLQSMSHVLTPGSSISSQSHITGSGSLHSLSSQSLAASNSSFQDKLSSLPHLIDHHRLHHDFKGILNALRTHGYDTTRFHDGMLMDAISQGLRKRGYEGSLFDYQPGRGYSGDSFHVMDTGGVAHSTRPIQDVTPPSVISTNLGSFESSGPSRSSMYHSASLGTPYSHQYQTGRKINFDHNETPGSIRGADYSGNQTGQSQLSTSSRGSLARHPTLPDTPHHRPGQPLTPPSTRRIPGFHLGPVTGRNVTSSRISPSNVLGSQEKRPRRAPKRYSPS